MDVPRNKSVGKSNPKDVGCVELALLFSTVSIKDVNIPSTSVTAFFSFPLSTLPRDSKSRRKKKP